MQTFQASGSGSGGFAAPERLQSWHSPQSRSTSSRVLNAWWAIISKAEQFFGVTNDQLLCGTKNRGGLETRRRYLDLLCGLVVNRPSQEAA